MMVSGFHAKPVQTFCQWFGPVRHIWFHTLWPPVGNHFSVMKPNLVEPTSWFFLIRPKDVGKQTSSSTMRINLPVFFLKRFRFRFNEACESDFGKIRIKDASLVCFSGMRSSRQCFELLWNGAYFQNYSIFCLLLPSPAPQSSGFQEPNRLRG